MFSKKEARHVIVNKTSLSQREQTHSQLAAELFLETAPKGQGERGFVFLGCKGMIKV